MTPPNPVLTLTGQGSGAVTKNVRLESGAKGFKIIVNILAGGTGTSPTLTVAAADIVPDGQPPATQNVAPALLTSAALAAGSAGITELTVYPGIAVAANVSANMASGQDIQITATVGGTTPSVNAQISVVSLF